MRKLFITIFILLTTFSLQPVYAMDVGTLDAGVESLYSEGVEAALNYDSTPDDYFASLLSSMQKGDWLPATGAGLMLLILFLRAMLSKRVKWFKTKLGGTTLGLVVSMLTVILLAVIAGKPITVGLVSMAIGMAMTAGGGWEYFKDVLGLNKKSEE